jgi:hypothetical protein
MVVPVSVPNDTERSGSFKLRGQHFDFSAKELPADPDHPRRWQINVWAGSPMPVAFLTANTFEDALARAKRSVNAR